MHRTILSSSYTLLSSVHMCCACVSQAGEAINTLNWWPYKVVLGLAVVNMNKHGNWSDEWLYKEICNSA